MNACQINVRKEEGRQVVTVERRNTAGTAIIATAFADDDFDAVLRAVEYELRQAFSQELRHV